MSRQHYEKGIATVAAQIKPSDFEMCDTKIREAMPLLGGPLVGKFSRVGDFSPSVQATCAAISLSDAPRAAYFAPYNTIVDGKPRGTPQPLGCVFTLQNGKIDVERGAPTKTNRATQLCALI